MVRARLLEPKPAASVPRDTEGLMVFVDAGQDDKRLAYEASHLLESRGVGYSLPMEPDTDTPAAEIRADLEANVTGCDAVLMVYREGPLSQVRGRLLSCHKMGAKRDSPLRLLAVCVAPSEAEKPLNIHLPEMQVINASDSCVESCVEAFLQAVHP
jgi:hypothetical protein